MNMTTLCADTKNQDIKGGISRRKIRVGSGKKIVWTSEPYQPGHGLLAKLVGREREMRLITAAWLGGRHSQLLSPLLIGEPGVGKNRLVYELTHRTGRELYIMQGHEDITAEDIACAVRFSDNNGRGMDYMVSPLATAMIRGGICFIDEIGKIRPRALALLVSVLDERRYIDSTLLGERVHAAPGFRFIAATNTGEAGILPEFIRSRLRPVIKVGFPEKTELNTIIGQQFPEVQPQLEQLLDTFWALWAKCGNAGRYPSPRDAIHLFALASSLGDLETDGARNAAGAVRKGGPSATSRSQLALNLLPVHLENAFAELFGEGGS